MRRFCLLLLCAATAVSAGERKARNIILFLGDAAGIPTLNAASIAVSGQPQKLFIQHMPYIALSDTSAANTWVTDSAAGMTAIVTGQKTNNGVLSQTSSGVRGQKDGDPLKTILEEAEERGMSTGVLSNSAMWDATPAACYAHVNDRKKTGEIFAQVVKPSFGDGVDLIIGPGRKAIYDSTAKLGINLDTALRERGYGVYDSLSSIPQDAKRVIALFDSADFDHAAAVERAIDILSKNRKGYFLMVESDLHTNNIARGLKRMAAFDAEIAKVASRVDKDTLILFTADHSFDLRIRGGRRDQSLPLESTEEPRSPLRMNNSHTGEEVLVAAQGPGASRVRGFLANTDIFHIMRMAYGWEKAAAK